MIPTRKVEIAAAVVAAVILGAVFVPFQKASAFTVDLALVNANPSSVPISAVGSQFLVTVNVSPGELISVSSIELTLDNGKPDMKHTVFDSNGHKTSGDPNLTRGNLRITIPSPSTSGYGYGYGYASAGTTFSPPYSYSFSAENASIAGNTYGYTYAVPNANLVNGFVGPGKILIEGKLNTALMSAGTHTLDVLIHTGAGGNGVDKLVAPQLVFTTIKGPPPTNVANLNVQAVDLSGKPLQGMWTTITKSSKGTNDIVKSDYTPVAFTGNLSGKYKVSVANYDGIKFVKWQDNNSTNSSRTITLPSGNTTLTAIYDTGNSLRGFTPLTYKLPELTVHALTLDGKTLLHMYAIVDPQSSSISGGTITITYKVYPGNFNGQTFDHWEDGSTQAVRTVTIHQDTAITAYYRAG